MVVIVTQQATQGDEPGLDQMPEAFGKPELQNPLIGTACNRKRWLRYPITKAKGAQTRGFRVAFELSEPSKAPFRRVGASFLVQRSLLASPVTGLIATNRQPTGFQRNQSRNTSRRHIPCTVNPKSQAAHPVRALGPDQFSTQEWRNG